MTRRNSVSNIPPLAIRLFYLAAVAVSRPLLMWSGPGSADERQRGGHPLLDAPSGSLAFGRSNRSPAIDESTLREFGPLPIRRSVLAEASASSIAAAALVGPREVHCIFM